MRAQQHPAVASGGEERQRRIREMFACVAPRYELVNSVTSFGLDRRWRRALVDSLALGPGDWCLDACCGTGDVSRAIARTGARVVGIDFSRPMLSSGASASAAAGVAGWLEGDARNLPFPTGAMDAACVAFGIRNVVPPESGITEMARVVRPGGRIAILEFSEPPNRLVRAMHRAYTRHVLPVVGNVISGRWGTYEYLPQSIGEWMKPEQLGRTMQDAGLVDVRWRPLTLGTVMLHVGVVGRR